MFTFLDYLSEMVRANQPMSVTKSIDRMIQQWQGVQFTKPKLAAVPEESPDPSSFCEDIDSSEFSDPSLYHNIFTKLIATSDIISADHSGQMQMQSVRGYQYVLFFIWNNYIHYEPMIKITAKSYFQAYESTITFSVLRIVFSTFSV